MSRVVEGMFVLAERGHIIGAMTSTAIGEQAEAAAAALRADSPNIDLRRRFAEAVHQTWAVAPTDLIVLARVLRDGTDVAHAWLRQTACLAEDAAADPVALESRLLTVAWAWAPLGEAGWSAVSQSLEEVEGQLA